MDISYVRSGLLYHFTTNIHFTDDYIEYNILNMLFENIIYNNNTKISTDNITGYQIIKYHTIIQPVCAVLLTLILLLYSLIIYSIILLLLSIGLIFLCLFILYKYLISYDERYNVVLVINTSGTSYSMSISENNIEDITSHLDNIKKIDVQSV
jgi:hypothetical protein